MGRIFISMSGEGRGHATRVRALTEALRKDHRVTLYAPGDAWALLAPLYEGTDVEVRHLPGLRFHYRRNDRISYLGTGGSAAGYVLGLPKLLQRLEEDLRRDAPDLVVTDFEPALPRAARRAGVPFASVTHQHFLVHGDFSALPAATRRHARWMGRFVRRYYSGQVATIVSGFHLPPMRPAKGEQVIPVGVMLRPSVRAARPTAEEHFIAYLRRRVPANVVQALRALPGEVRVYGLGEREPDGNLRFRPVSESGFVADLATARALVCTAGNQLVGEALYLDKPVFAMPEPANHEQTVNAHLLADTGHGRWEPVESVAPEHLLRFCEELDDLRPGARRARFDGTARTVQILRGLVRGTAAGWRPAAAWSIDRARPA